MIIYWLNVRINFRLIYDVVKVNVVYLCDRGYDFVNFIFILIVIWYGCFDLLVKFVYKNYNVVCLKVIDLFFKFCRVVSWIKWICY